MATSCQHCNSVSVRLDETNYPTWVFQMQHYLRGHGLLKLVDGSHPCPSKFIVGIDGSLIANTEAYEKWLQQDSFVISMITNTLSAEALTLVIGCETSMEVWITLKQHYAANSEFHIMQLKSTLQNIRKGTDSIDKYLLRFKTVRDHLAVVGIRISDQDVKSLILAGLPIEYGPTRQIIRGKHDIAMNEVRSLLLSAEFEIELQNKALSLSSLTAMVAQNSMKLPQGYTCSPTVSNVGYHSAYSNASLSNGCVLQNGNGSFSQPNNGFIQQNCGSQQNNGLQLAGISLHQPNGFSQPNFTTSQANSGTMQQFNFQPNDCFMPNGVVYNAVGIGYHNACATGAVVSDRKYMSASSTKEMENKKELLSIEKDRLASETIEDTIVGDTLDAYMSGLSSQLVLDKTEELQKELSDLQSEYDRNSQSCKQNISTDLRFDTVRENSLSDVVDAAASNEVEGPKSLDSTEPSEGKNTIHSSADVVFSPKNLVDAAVSEVMKKSVSENKSTSDKLHIMQKNSMGNSAGLVSLNGKTVHGGHKDVEHGINESLVQTLEAFTDSHNNKKRVTETAASNIIWKRFSKDIDQSGVKPESHRQLEVDVSKYDFGCLSSLPHNLPDEAILEKIEALRTQSTWRFPSSPPDTTMLNCRQASRPMKLWRSLLLIPPG